MHFSKQNKRRNSVSEDQMWTVSFLLLLLAVSVESLVCRIGEQSCGSNSCFNPSTARCNNETGKVECFNSCNGTCYSSSQYCYNDTKICNNIQLVCDVKNYSRYAFPLGIACYDPSQYTCHNNLICSKQYTCGTECLDGYSVCIKNQTVFCGRYFADYTFQYVNLCGPQKQCYESDKEICLGRNTVCSRQYPRLCGKTCFNPNLQICVNRTVQCINSCNGTCYLSSQYCYKNSKICNKGESVCNVIRSNLASWHRDGLICYNPSQQSCLNNDLCYLDDICGTRCRIIDSICINNETICPYGVWTNVNSLEHVSICGPQKTCYDARKAVCLNGTTICEGLNAQLCGTNCFNPNTQICDNGNVQCVNSCNGTCYSNSQYCYNNTKICNNDQLVCDVKHFSDILQPSFRVPVVDPMYGLSCYDPSVLRCLSNALCYRYDTCGTQCLTQPQTFCVNNQAICPFYTPIPGNIEACGPQQECYDTYDSVCLGNPGIVCPIGHEFCSGVCYNPQLEYCSINNSTIDCLKNPSAPSCNSTGAIGD